MVWLRLKAACICAVYATLIVLNINCTFFWIRFGTLWEKEIVIVSREQRYMYQVGFPEYYGLSTIL